MNYRKMQNLNSFLKAICASGLLIFFAWGCQKPNQTQESLTFTDVNPFPKEAITTMASMEEFNDYLKRYGFGENEIQDFLKSTGWEDLFANDDLDLRSNCSCSDDAGFTVSRIGDLFIARTFVTPYEPAVFLEWEQYTCDGTSINASDKLALGNLLPCYDGDQIVGIDFSNAACISGCQQPTLYDLHFSLERTGTWAQDCDHKFFYDVECDF